MRKAHYDLDENELKPYFELHNVLQNGVFYAANKLYGITFKQRHDIPVYQPDVRVFEVFDKDGSPLGLMYFDYFKRDNKSGGAWMSNFVEQSKLLGTKPVIYNVANFTKPAPGQPALISFDDVTTMFHEFGHALHGLFANQTYPTAVGHQRGARLRRIPLPVQRALGALSRGAQALCGELQDRHQPIPQAWWTRSRSRRPGTRAMRWANCWRRRSSTCSGMTLPADAPKQDVDAFETKALKDTRHRFPQCAAALSLQLFPAYLGQWLCRRLLRLSVDGDAGRRCL